MGLKLNSSNATKPLSSEGIVGKLNKYIHTDILNQPRGLYVLLYTEVCELFGQFSISALLVLYMTTHLATSDGIAFTTYGTFIAIIYAIPILTGYLADRVFGFKNIIYLGIVLMMLGELILAAPGLKYFYIGLALFSVGCGFFTPAITAVLGNLYNHHDSKRDNAFVLYYIAKNIGALFATISCSLIATTFGFTYAFLFGAFVVFSGYIVFSIGSSRIFFPLSCSKNINYKNQSLLLVSLSLALTLIAYLALTSEPPKYLAIVITLSLLILLATLYFKFEKKEKIKMAIILSSVAAMVIFSMLLGQGGTTLNLFIDRIINRNIIGSVTIPTSMFYALNPFFMILLGPFVMFLLAKISLANKTADSFAKIGLGLAILGAGFLIFFIAATLAMTSNAKPSFLYVVSAYALFPVAELCIMPIVISLITRISPIGYTGMMIGIYLFGNAISSYLTGQFSKIGNVNFNPLSSNVFIDTSRIYQHVFSISTITLLFFALIVFAMVFIIKNSVPDKKPLN